MKIPAVLFEKEFIPIRFFDAYSTHAENESCSLQLISSYSSGKGRGHMVLFFNRSRNILITGIASSLPLSSAWAIRRLK